MEDFFVASPTLRCNNNCVFCYDAYGCALSDDLDLDTIISKIEFEFRESGMKNLAISGGEPTLYPYLIDLIKYFSSKEIVISLFTNGRRLCDANYLQDLVDAGVKHFHVAFHGSHSKLHDSLTKVEGSYIQALKGIENISKMISKDISFSLGCVIVNDNVNDILDFLKMFSKFNMSSIIFKHCIVENASPEIFDEYIVPYDILREIISQIMENNFYSFGNHFRLYFDSTPPCVLKGFEKLCLDYKKVRFKNTNAGVVFKNKSLRKYTSLSNNSKERVKPPICQNCVLFEYCAGILVRYYKMFGSRGIFPYTLEQLKSNIF